jgi:hypothetical protein
MARPQAFFNLDDDEDKIRAMQFTCDVVKGSDTALWISPVDHSGTLTMYTKSHPLQMNFIADDRNSLFVRLDDPLLKGILEEVESKVMAVAPQPEQTNGLISRDASGRYGDTLKLKCRYTQWVDATTGDKMSAEEALSSKKNRITSWVIQVYRLNSFRGRWYYAVNVISAKVSRASESPPPAAGKRKREDFTQYL